MCYNDVYPFLEVQMQVSATQVMFTGLMLIFLGTVFCSFFQKRSVFWYGAGVVVLFMGILGLFGPIILLAVSATQAEFRDRTAEIQAQQTQQAVEAANLEDSFKACMAKLFPEKETWSSSYTCTPGETPCMRYIGNTRVAGMSGTAIFTFNTEGMCILLPNPEN